MNLRKTLVNKRRILETSDMEKVYELLESGWKVKDVAQKFGVSRSTLYRRHKEYQEDLEKLLPPLPEEFSPEEK